MPVITNFIPSFMTTWHVDKLCLHILTLTLIIDDFSTDVSDIRDDLRLDARRVSQLFSELGCKLSSPTEADRLGRLGGISKKEADSHKMAKLKLPLQFPKQRVNKRA